jgi:hypothetical protein
MDVNWDDAFLQLLAEMAISKAHQCAFPKSSRRRTRAYGTSASSS